MGLLDFNLPDLNSPEGQGLLAASLSLMQAKQMPGQSGAFSSALGQAGQQYMGVRNQAQDADIKRKMAILQEKRAQSAFDMQQDAYKGITGNSAVPTGVTGGPMPSGAPTAPAGQNAAFGMDSGDTNAQLVRLEKMAIAGVPGAKEAFEIYKYKSDPVQLQPGTFSQNRVTGKREYVPDVKTGMGYGADGMYALPGSDVLSKLEADKARAVEGAKAGLDLVDVPLGNGQSQKMPRSKAVQMLSTPPSIGSRQPTPQESALIAADAKANGIQNPVVNLSSSPTAFGLTPSEADKTRAVETAKADVTRDTGKQGAAKLYGQMKEGISRAITLLDAGPTASGAGAMVDAGANFFGKSTKGADTAAQLDTLAGWLTSNVPRMEGPQSDRDVMNYRIMAGAVGDRTKPLSQRLAAAKEVQSLQNKYAELNGYAEDKKPAAPMDSLPIANASNKGRKIRDTTTDKVLRSNGMSWVEDK